MPKPKSTALRMDLMMELLTNLFYEIAFVFWFPPLRPWALGSAPATVPFLLAGLLLALRLRWLFPRKSPARRGRSPCCFWWCGAPAPPSPGRPRPRGGGAAPSPSSAFSLFFFCGVCPYRRLYCCCLDLFPPPSPCAPREPRDGSSPRPLPLGFLIVQV